MKLSDFSIRRPVFTIVTMILFMLLGVVSVLNIPLKLIPDINPPVGAVVVNYQGANPTEVVEKVTKPLEESLSTLSGLKSIRSVSQEGSSLTILEFSWTTSIDNVQDDINNKINQTPLPEDVENPRFLKFDPSQFPVIQFAVSSSQEGRKFQEQMIDLQRELLQVEGIASVDMNGDRLDEITVQLNQEALQENKLSQDDIVNAIRSNDVSMPGAPITTEEEKLTTRVISSLTSVEEIQNLVITKNTNGEDVLLGDLGIVEKRPEQMDTITRVNQEPAVLMNILQRSDANTSEVSKGFNERISQLLEESDYENLETAILFDQGEYIQEAIGNVTNALILGGLLAMIVLFFFLRNLKSPLIIGISIPFSVIVTFVLIYFADFSLNIMTLGGLALGIGMLVDNSIVVIENIYRHLQMGKEPKEAASAGAKEMAGAITASTLTTVAVFLPVVFITGLIGNLFKELGLTIAFSLFASLFVALTVVPMIASRILKAPKENEERKRRESRVLTAIENSTRWTLHHRFLVLALTVLLLVGGAFGMTTVGMQFLPSTDEGFFTIRVVHENGTPLNQTEKTVANIETVLANQDEIKDYFSLIGGTQSQGPASAASANKAEIYVSMVDLKERDRSTQEIAAEIKSDINGAAGEAEVTFSTQSSTGTAPDTLSFVVSDNNEKRLNDAVTAISEKVKELNNVLEISNDQEDTVEEIQITVNRTKAQEQGFVPAQIANIVNSVMRGEPAAQITTESKEVLSVNVRYDEEITKDIAALKGLLLRKPDGTYTKLEEVTSIERGTGPVAINRVDQESSVEFTVKYSRHTNLGDLSKAVDEAIADLDLPEEVEISYTGDRELLNSSVDDLGFAFLLAVVFVFLVMAAQFESFKYPFVIMFAIPLILIGVTLALTLTRTPLSITAIIGLVILVGIVVNNAIVLVDYINQKKAEGWKSFDAIVEAVKVRMRPILMTATTTILGLIPLAIGLGEGSEIQQPLGITVIGGLISSTFLTLFIIPVIYSLFDKETRHLNKKYITTDGQLIPAYLIDDYIEKESTEKNKPAYIEREQKQERKRDLSKEEVIALLEQIITISKKEDKNDN
ncbi:efflux RND transporter permease subunit [Bacillus taeanensis]|uniref:AcrB/AcrD/AcrF family protein n=1 Tax=Bacillus taeanensis TaxID=273032 RepID=A0A366Y1Z4_9BACI|nr:efflux RND transporter permease subunit [Bacillus taeanensis]RBW71405.1 AcrB/AcrD/AcrF family protein [Bacillus taeanensis]